MCDYNLFILNNNKHFIYTKSGCTCKEAVSRHHISTLIQNVDLLGVQDFTLTSQLVEERRQIKRDVRKQGLTLEWPLPDESR